MHNEIRIYQMLIKVLFIILVVGPVMLAGPVKV